MPLRDTSLRIGYSVTFSLVFKNRLFFGAKNSVLLNNMIYLLDRWFTAISSRRPTHPPRWIGDPHPVQFLRIYFGHGGRFKNSYIFKLNYMGGGSNGLNLSSQPPELLA